MTPSIVRAAPIPSGPIPVVAHVMLTWATEYAATVPVPVTAKVFELAVCPKPTVLLQKYVLPGVVLANCVFIE